MQTTTQSTPTTQKPLKRQKGLGRLNRLIAKAQQMLRANGYEMRRFSRDYETGTATSRCKKTDAYVVVNIYGMTDAERLYGAAFSEKAKY